jgi:hypothetical protein
MRYTMSSQPRSNVGVEDPKAADHRAFGIREQRKSDAILLRKTLENFPGIVAAGHPSFPVLNGIVPTRPIGSGNRVTNPRYG